MAHVEESVGYLMTEPANEPAPAKKADRRKQTIIAASGVGVLIVTFMLVKRSGTAATTTSGGGVAGSTDTSLQDALAQNTSALGSVQNGLNYLTGALTGGTTVATGSTTPATTTGGNTLTAAFKAATSRALAIVNNPSATGRQKAGSTAALAKFNTDLAGGKTIDQALADTRAIASGYSKAGDAKATEGANQVVAALTPLHGQQATTKSPTAS